MDFLLTVSRVFVTVVFITVWPFTVSQVLEYNLPEEVPVFTYIGNIAADANFTTMLNVDKDDLDNMEYRFLTQSNPHANLFNISDKNSSLYVAQRIDRETICEFIAECIIKLDVICRTNSGSFYRKINVLIHILDENDNTPTFAVTSIDLEMSEGSLNGTSLPVEGAVDMDSELFSVKSYRIIPNNTPFNVHYQKNVDGSSIVRIILIGQLDRETKDTYQFQLLAEDGGIPARSGVLAVNLVVTDINDHAPVFSRSVYNFTVNEDIAVNTTIAILSATDDDINENADIKYSLSNHQTDKIHSLFSIGQNTGELKVIGSLIYEPGQSHRVVVEARDSAKPPLNIQAVVMIYVNDTHNNPPQITVDLLSNTNTAEITENSDMNVPVAHITVSDPDTGMNGIVNCSVDSLKFKLQRFNVHEYKVVVAQALDREIQNEYSVQVKCHDKGTPSLNASKVFVIRIMDENDNTPRFGQQTYHIHTPEDNAIGASILRVSASDFDSGRNADIKYSLEPSGYEFSIDSKSGIITADFKLDRETTSIIPLRVFATDNGTSPKTGTTDVVIELTDVNDNKPEFQNESFEFAVQENTGKQTSVGLLIATDKDEGKNKNITFSLLSQNSAGIPFEVLSDGTILTKEVLDRETIERYEFSVVATDDGVPPQKSSAKVVVRVLDVNDNSPVFVFPSDNNSTVTISYQTMPNTVIAHLETRDYDDGLNATVTYFTRDKNNSNLFQLNSLSGRLLLISKLTLNHVGKYKINIIAQDKGTPPRVNERVMTVIVSSQPLGGAPGHTEEEDHKYFLIAIAISCVTAVIAVVIILTICLIRRADMIKMKYEDPQANVGTNPGTPEPKKKVSFTFNDSSFSTIPPRSPYDDYNSQLYPAINSSNSGVQQVTAKGITANLGQGDKIHHQLSSFKLQHPLVRNGEAPRRPGSHMSIHSYKDGDNSSDHSAEVTNSDSGRGGSDDDLNSSTVFSSLEFDHFKQSSPRTKSFGTFSSFGPRNKTPRSLQLSQDSDLNQHRISKVSFGDHFFNFENNQDGLFPRLNSISSDNGQGIYGSYNDDSTTTSGSYTLDPEDDFLEVTRPSKQCIV